MIDRVSVERQGDGKGRSLTRMAFDSDRAAMTLNDPNIPAGYVDSQGSDGAIPEALKIYSLGTASGGYPKYGDLTTNPTWPNGIINSPSGNKVSPDR